jgi:hypothetical protein
MMEGRKRQASALVVVETLVHVTTHETKLATGKVSGHVCRRKHLLLLLLLLLMVVVVVLILERRPKVV